MALILTSPLYYESLPEKTRKEYRVASYYVEVSKKYLSDYYLLDTGSRIHGKILKAHPRTSQIEDTEVEFILFKQPLGSTDKLYFTESSWCSLRNYGLIPDETILKIKLTKVKHNYEIIELFPYRDVEDDRIKIAHETI